MKSAILICLFVFSIATESRHLQKRHHEQQRHIHAIVKQVGISTVEKLILVMLAQDFQKCTPDEHMKAQAKIMEVVNNCVKHPEEADCQKPAMTLYHDTVCKDPDVEQLYPWTTDCCGKTEEERIKCFFKHREIKVKEYKIPDIEAACKEHKEHPERAFAYFISNIAARHSRLYQPAVLGFALQYNQITGECCAAEEKAKCFLERMTQVKKLTNYIEAKHKQTCRIVKVFPGRVTGALTLAQISQKFPNAEFGALEKLTLEIVHMKEDCCKGDAVECMIERMEATEHMCADKDKLSDKLGVCCAKDILERTPCIIAMPNDESAVSKDLKVYYEDEHVCENYQKDKTKYLALFTYDYARRHQESSPQSCLRVSKGYEQLLEKCCSAENHGECLKGAPLILDAAQKENEELVKQNCGGLAKLGLKDFAVHLLVRYFLKMPQVQSSTIATLATKMTETGVYCCALADDKKQSCAEEKLDLHFGELCESEKEEFINDDVHHCCADSYANRRPCFSKLGPCPNYVPPEFDADKIHLTDALCKGSAEEQLKNRLILLVEFMKMKPHSDQAKLKEVIEAFRKVTEKCCAEENQQKCYDEEKAEIVKVATKA